MEVEREGFDSCLVKQINTIVEMIDVLDFYAELETRYFNTIREILISASCVEEYYRSYAYNLLTRNTLPVFLDCIHNIIRFVNPNYLLHM